MTETNTSTKPVQFTKKQLEIARELVEGYSHRDIVFEEIAPMSYIENHIGVVLKTVLSHARSYLKCTR